MRADPIHGSAASWALATAGLLAVLAVLTWPLRESVYLAIAPGVAASSASSALAGAVAAYGPLLLVALAAVLAVGTFVRNRAAFWRLGAGGLGVLVAYLLGKATKILVAEVRPCQVWDVPTALSCPAVGDWSWPSNHSLIAAAFATACLIAVPRSAWFAIPVALLAGFARLTAGVHYLHDVCAGLALGTAVVALVVLALRPVLARLPVPAPHSPT